MTGTGYANPKRYRGDALHFACPLDLFDAVTKAALYEKLGSSDQKRTIEPRCGEVNQDIVGTAQGNWITGVSGNDPIDQPGNWDKSLALVHDNFDPLIGVASVGGVIGNPTKLSFTPIHEGTVNREFSEVKPDGNIYCYEGRSLAQYQKTPQKQRVLIELTSTTSLKAELQTGTCSGSVNFSNPAIYNR